MFCEISKTFKSEDDITKSIIIKNLLIACLSVQFCYIGVNGVAVIQSTLNNAQGLGLTSSAVTYGMFGLSGIIFNEIIKTKIGIRKCILFPLKFNSL